MIILFFLLSTKTPISSGSNFSYTNPNDSPIVSILSPEDNTTLYISQNISVEGFATDDSGIVEFGYTISWDTGSITEIYPINSTVLYEFNFPLMIYNGQNNITVHAIDDEGNWGNMTIRVFFQNYNRILYVDDDGDADFTCIQDAVTNARDGDTVFVYNGTYSDFYPDNMANVRIEKNIKLIGENKYNTIINGTGFQRIIIINSENVSISGFTIQHGEDRDEWSLGIDIHYYKSDNIRIFDNIIKNNNYGIRTHQSSGHIHIHNNMIINNKYGIECEFDTTPLNIYNNTIKENEYGIYSIDSQMNISNNIISDNTFGINNRRSTSVYTIASNNINNNDIGIKLDTSITKIKHNNLISNNKQVEVTMDFLVITSYSYFIYRQDWIGNYWDDWKKTQPRPITGKANIYIIILRIHPKLTTPIRIFVLPYIEYDRSPSIEPYDI